MRFCVYFTWVFLISSGQELSDIMKTLEHLIVYENYEKEEDDESNYV